MIGRNNDSAVRNLVRRAHELDLDSGEFDLLAGLADVSHRATLPEQANLEAATEHSQGVQRMNHTLHRIRAVRLRRSWRPVALAATVRVSAIRQPDNVRSSVPILASIVLTLLSITASFVVSFGGRLSVSDRSRATEHISSRHALQPHLVSYDSTAALWNWTVGVTIDDRSIRGESAQLYPQSIWLLATDDPSGTDFWAASKFTQVGHYTVSFHARTATDSAQGAPLSTWLFYLVQTHTDTQAETLEHALDQTTTTTLAGDTTVIDHVAITVNDWSTPVEPSTYSVWPTAAGKPAWDGVPA